jgi:hypothetical protein
LDNDWTVNQSIWIELFWADLFEFSFGCIGYQDVDVGQKTVEPVMYANFYPPTRQHMTANFALNRGDQAFPEVFQLL